MLLCSEASYTAWITLQGRGPFVWITMIHHVTLCLDGSLRRPEWGAASEAATLPGLLERSYGQVVTARHKWDHRRLGLLSPPFLLYSLPACLPASSLATLID
jgi:hypothetical protein